MRTLTASAPHHAHGPPSGHAHGESGGEARIGPNAIIQTARALSDRYGEAYADTMLADATPWRIDRLPEAMVDERSVGALARAVLETLPIDDGAAVMRDSGVRTAEYLLRVRIPGPIQSVLRLLPRALALRLLMKAIARHSWTFAGSGTFAVAPISRRGGAFTVTSCPMCRQLHADRPACHYYAATFETLIRRIVSRGATVREVECEAAGGASCRFVIEL